MYAKKKRKHHIKEMCGQIRQTLQIGICTNWRKHIPETLQVIDTTSGVASAKNQYQLIFLLKETQKIKDLS